MTVTVNEGVFSKTYDFVTACEVVEHLHNPQIELDRLFNLLKPDGVLAIKTQFLPLKDEFSDWYYKRDLTHVCFFSEQSFKFFEEALLIGFADANAGVLDGNRKMEKY